jgi:hypothetical protein
VDRLTAGGASAMTRNDLRVLRACFRVGAFSRQARDLFPYSPSDPVGNGRIVAIARVYTDSSFTTESDNNSSKRERRFLLLCVKAKGRNRIHTRPIVGTSAKIPREMNAVSRNSEG